MSDHGGGNWRDSVQQETISDRGGASLQGPSVVRWVGRRRCEDGSGRARLIRVSQGQRWGSAGLGGAPSGRSVPPERILAACGSLVDMVRSARPIRAVRRGRLTRIHRWTGMDRDGRGEDTGREERK